jgi:CO dehydrogenase/acetyl-CoA synthase epsilon subunit
MAKKKFRDITVNGNKYAWRVKVDDPYEYPYLNIWKQGKIRTLIYCDKTKVTVTPKVVREIIEKLVAGNKTRQEEARARAKKAVPKGKITTAEINAALENIFKHDEKL